MEKKERNSNIELLRIVAILGVVVLHYNGMVGFGAVQTGSVNEWILLFLESLFICAVDLFILVSGFFMSKTRGRRLIKVIELVVMVMFAGAVKFALGLIGPGFFSLKGLISALIPNNYFITLYLTLYLVSPYINKVTDALSARQYRNFLLLAMLLFSVIPTGLDGVAELTGRVFGGLYPISSSGSQYGYNIVNFMLMYLLGGYLRRLQEEDKLLSAGKSAALLAVSLVVSFGMQKLCPSTARSYCDPAVIGLAVGAFCLFSRLSFQSKAVNLLAKSTLMCFLLHDFFLLRAGIAEAVQRNFAAMLLHLAATAAVIFGISFGVWFVYDLCSKRIWRWLGSKMKKADDILSV